MILVIFGAGASYDSVASRPPDDRYGRYSLFSRPPLASELFLAENFFLEAIRRFPRCHPIVPYLQSLPSNVTIEHSLEILQAEVSGDPERARQLASIRCYLQYLIIECEHRWDNEVAGGITNYLTLLDQLRRTGREILIVTFNYDRLIELALDRTGRVIAQLSDYISIPGIKLIKIHGSVHWAREVDSEIADVGQRNDWELMNELIDRAPDLKVSDRFRIFNGRPVSRAGETPLVPAIAIPVETKTGFECPIEHLGCLRANISKVEKILIVGWRGTENHFLSLLREDGLRKIPAQVVDCNRKSAEEVLHRLTGAGLRLIGHPADEEGFTPYVVARKAEQFLSG